MSFKPYQWKGKCHLNHNIIAPEWACPLYSIIMWSRSVINVACFSNKIQALHWQDYTNLSPTWLRVEFPWRDVYSFNICGSFMVPLFLACRPALRMSTSHSLCHLYAWRMWAIKSYWQYIQKPGARCNDESDHIHAHAHGQLQWKKGLLSVGNKTFLSFR